MKYGQFLPRALALVGGLTLLPGPAWGQDAADLMRSAIAAQAERLSGVENVSIVQEVMGMEMTLYMEKRDAEGTPILIPVSVTAGGMTNPIPQDMAQADWSNPFQEEWVSRVRLEGSEVMDGNPVLVFTIDDFSDLEIPSLPGGAQGIQDFRPSWFRYALDEEGLFMRRVDMRGEALKDDGTRAPIEMTMVLEDYRETGGYLHPFVTRVTTEGVMEAADIDREQIQAQLDQIRAQLDNIPEAQRAMMENMINAQIQQLEAMLGSEGGVEMTMTVREVRVNAGPPGGGQ